MADNYGPGVSRVLDPVATQYLDVIWQQGKPPLDSELNLLQDLATNWRQIMVSRGAPSGWLGNETNNIAEYVTNPTWSNWFQFGRQRTGETQAVCWAVVNGWLIPVTGTRTGSPPGAPDNTDTWNKIAMDPPPSNAGDLRIDFVFLEAWVARVPPNPSTLNKPAASAVYTYGNVEGGYSFLPDDIQDPAVGAETTERVQLQYRIRVQKGLVGFSTNPDGFDPAVVFAQGAASAQTTYNFANMRKALGDPGLWRAGDGSSTAQTALGTVDGYSYAIPISAVFRRNSAGWNGNPSQNLNGGFNRNPTAVDRTGIQTFSTVPTLAVDLSATATVATLASAANIPLPINPATAVLIQIGDELLTYTAITTGSPPQLTGLSRGTNGTRAELHRAGTVVKVISGRPDGLFSDQIALTDILDLRHAVNPNGFDYQALLKGNIDRLMRGQLRANWKRTGAGPQGPFVVYQDAITDGAVSLGVSQLDAFDGIRQIFSDAAALQRAECICQANSTSLPSTVTGAPVGFEINLTAFQPSLGVNGQPGRNLLHPNQFNPGDTIQVPVNQLQGGLSAGNSDQVRWVYDGLPNAVVIRLDGQNFPVSPSLYTVTGSTPAGGPVTNVTNSGGLYEIQTTSPHHLRTGQTVIISGVIGTPGANGTWSVTVVDPMHFTLTGSTFAGAYTSGGSTFSPNLTPNDDLVITLGANFPVVTNPNLINITLNIMYGPGRGLSRRPDSLATVAFINPSTELLVRPMGVPASNQQTKVSWLPLWQKYRPYAYKGNVPVAAECLADLGSKSVVVAPFRHITMPSDVLTVDGTIANPYVTTPITSSNGDSIGTTFTDPMQNFVVSGINPGDTLILTSGPQPGRYTILAVAATTLTTSNPLPVASNLTYTIEHVVDLVASANGSVLAAGVTFTDTTVNFTTAGVVAGDVLIIVIGTYPARYTVATVGTTTLTVQSHQVFGGINIGAASSETGITYLIAHAQGNMPLSAANGTTPKWTTTDPLALFSGSAASSPATKNLYVTIPRHLAPGWGELNVPILWEDIVPFAQGVNFMSLSVEGSTYTDNDKNYVPYSNTVSYAIFSTLNFGPPIVPAVYNTAFGPSNSWAGMRQFTDARGLGRQGLELPPFYGVARLFAVYEANDYHTNGSAFNTSTRTPLVSGGATNLLRQNLNPGDGPVMWVEIDVDGDSTFILNANAIDITRSPNAIANFAAGNYVIEASIFGFDRGSFDITKDFRLVLTNPTGSAAMRQQANGATRNGVGGNVGAAISGPITVLPGPATSADQLVINYSRTPYQGDAWGSQTNYIDIAQNVGPLQSGTAYQIVSQPLNQSQLTRPNQKLFEVLASVGFATTLGTGRISGDASTYGVNVRDVGYEDPSAYPPNSPVAPRPVTLTGSFLTDYPEVGTEYLGATERLPLGSLFRDADFRGGTMGVATMAPLVYFDQTGADSPASNLAVNTALEQTEVLLDTSTQATGAPSDLIAHVDGEQSNYSLLVNFRTARGGSVFTAGGGHPGGEVVVQQPSVQAPDAHTNVVNGRAYLVRNYTTSVGANEVSAGSELMMLVVTNVERLSDPFYHPGFINIGTNGTGEGFAAADFYRIDGHPLVNDNVRLLVDPTTIALSRRST